MAFISNVTFGPRCCECKGPNARPHSKYGYICPDCYYEYRFQTYLEEREDEIAFRKERGLDLS